MDLNNKKLSQLHNESVIRKIEVKDLETERKAIEDEIESRLCKNCSLYSKIIETIKSENVVPFSVAKNYEKIRFYETFKSELRDWLLDNPRFVEELV